PRARVHARSMRNSSREACGPSSWPKESSGDPEQGTRRSLFNGSWGQYVATRRRVSDELQLLCDSLRPGGSGRPRRVGTRFMDAPIQPQQPADTPDRKSTRLNSSHVAISYAVFCLKKKIRY